MMAAAVVFALLLGLCLFIGLPRVQGWRRAGSVAAFFLLTGVVYAGTVDFLGAPKPMRLEWRGLENATVLSAKLNEGVAIYVWVQTPGAAEPRAYALPWSTQMAQQVQDAMEKRASSGMPVQMGPPQGGGSGDPRFYAEPHRAPPPKADLRKGAVEYSHPGG
jgi:hypothetical protein